MTARMLTPEQIKAAADRAQARAEGKTDEAAIVDAALSEGELDAEITKLAVLSIGVYESVRVAEAKRLAVRAGILDKLVAAKRPRRVEGDEQGTAIELVEREPAVAAVDGQTLLKGIIDEMGLYVFLPENEKIAIALWIIASYAFDSFYIFPRLRLKSATKGCGKSTVLDIIEHLVNKPLIPSNITGPGLFRLIAAHRPTMLLDEADRYVNDNNDLISIIDAGHKKNGTAIRCDGDPPEPRAFSVWAPMAIAGIRALTGTVEDRAIMITLTRKPHGVKMKRFRGDRPAPALAELASQAARWALDHQIALGNADPETTLMNRTADNWLPLFAVADEIGGEWPKSARAAAAIRPLEDDELGVRLLADIREVLTGDEMHSAPLVSALVEKEGAPWGEVNRGRALTTAKLGSMLREFDIRPEQIKIGGINRNGYRRAAFEAIWEAYFPPDQRPPVHPGGSKVYLSTKSEKGPENGHKLHDSEGLPGDDGNPAVDPSESQESKQTQGLNGKSRDVDPQATLISGLGRPPRAVSDTPEARHPEDPDRICSQCAAAGEPLATLTTADGRTVLLHPECRKFWLRANPQPEGSVLAAVMISEIALPAAGGRLPWTTPTITEVTDPVEAAAIRAACETSAISAGPTDSLNDFVV
jgi:Protein of unknown function (DUF3631)